MLSSSIEQLEEMDEHLGYEKYSLGGDKSGNSRNWMIKIIKSKMGKLKHYAN